MHKITKITFVIIALGIAAYLVSFFIQIPSSGHNGDSSTQLMFANSILHTSLYTGAAILFLIGASAYKAALRVAYMAISIGIVLLGVGLAQVVLLRVFGLLDSPWVQYGGVTLPFVAAGLSIYLGTRSMAKLIGIASPLTKVAFILPLLLTCIILVILTPHGASPLPEIFFDVSNVISVWEAVLYLVSFGLVFQIKNRSGSHYTKSMVWLMLGLLISVIIILTVLLANLITGTSLAGYTLDILIIIGGFLYLKAGQSFAKTKEL
jgi:hypothetical protein